MVAAALVVREERLTNAAAEDVNEKVYKRWYLLTSEIFSHPSSCKHKRLSTSNGRNLGSVVIISGH